jgi:hypothetical protein
MENTLKSTFTLENASKPTFEIDHSSKPTFAMEKILMCRPPLSWGIYMSPLCLLENLPERMQEKKTRKAGIEVPILILISAASLTLYSPNSPL